jgi:nucleoid DNA-binding protein
MTRDELIRSLAQAEGLSLATSRQALELVLEAIGDQMERGGRVELRGFGVFYARDLGARVANLPGTTPTRQLPARRAPAFRAGKELQLALNTVRSPPQS